MTTAGVQLELFDLAAMGVADRRLADRLRDRRTVPSDGATRLLRAIVRNGLDETALVPAAALVIALDDAGRRQASP